MRDDPAHTTAAEQLRRESAAAALVREVNTTGTILLIDPHSRFLRAYRGELLTLELKGRIALQLLEVIDFLEAEAYGGGR